MLSKISAWFLGSIGLFLGIAAPAVPSNQLPQRPDYYVLDETKALDGRTIHAIESLLTEHDRLTNEQVMVAILKNTDKTLPQTYNLEKEWTHRLFVHWKVGKRHLNEGLLLTIFLESGHTFLELGYGLESKLSEIQSKDSIEEVVTAHLRHNDLKAAAIWGAYQILEVLASPLIQNGKAIEILRRDGIATPSPLTHELNELPTGDSGIWLFLLFLGISLITFVFYQILSREAHFTGNGWYLDYPWSKRYLHTFFKGKTTPKFEGGSACGSW